MKLSVWGWSVPFWLVNEHGTWLARLKTLIFNRVDNIRYIFKRLCPILFTKSVEPEIQLLIFLMSASACGWRNVGKEPSINLFFEPQNDTSQKMNMAPENGPPCKRKLFKKTTQKQGLQPFVFGVGWAVFWLQTSTNSTGNWTGFSYLVLQTPQRIAHVLGPIYLEPKWPLFSLEKALFWGVDLQKQRSFGFQVYIFIDHLVGEHGHPLLMDAHLQQAPASLWWIRFVFGILLSSPKKRVGSIRR